MSRNDDKNRQARIEALAEKAGRSVHDMMMFVERDGLEYCESIMEGIEQGRREYRKSDCFDSDVVFEEMQSLIEEHRSEKSPIK
jgi:hypothetical protein